MEDTQKKLDKALKRNLSTNQQSQATTAIAKTASTDLPNEEPIGESDDADPIDE